VDVAELWHEEDK